MNLVAGGGDAAMRAVVGAFRRGLDRSQEPFSDRPRLTDGDEEEQNEQGEQDEMTHQRCSGRRVQINLQQ